MGYYFRGHIDIVLKPTTPKEIIDFIVNGDYHKLNHTLFFLDRGYSLGGLTQFFDLPKPTLEITNKGYYHLIKDVDINYGNDEIEQFVRLLEPHAASRKKNYCVGWYQGEDQQERINLYINESK